MEKKDNKGFTLVELLIVISIISILVAIVLIAIDPRAVIQRTNDTKKRSELNAVKASLQLFLNENNRYPTNAEGLGVLETDYIRELPQFTINYNQISATDYEAGIDLDRPNVAGNDSRTATKCNPTVSGDYFICPD